MNKSESIGKLAEALSKTQGTIKGAIKDSKSHFGTYSDLASVWEACREQLAENHLSVVQTPCDNDLGISVETILMHSSGEWISNVLTIPVDKNNAHGVGSALTYARRYSLSAMVGIAPMEDDGDEAVKSMKTIKSLPEKEFKDFKSRIKSAQTKEDAESITKEANKACNKIKDVDSYESIKKVFVNHCKLIDSATKSEMNGHAHV